MQLLVASASEASERQMSSAREVASMRGDAWQNSLRPDNNERSAAANQPPSPLKWEVPVAATPTSKPPQRLLAPRPNRSLAHNATTRLRGAASRGRADWGPQVQP